MSPSRPTGPEIESLCRTLEGAYDKQELELLLELHHPEVARLVSETLPPHSYVRRVVLKAIQLGVLDRLLERVLRERPQSSAVRAAVLMIRDRLAVRGADDAALGLSVDDVASWVSEESLTSPGDPFVSLQRLTEWMIQVEAQVCQVRSGTGLGSGFLVGENRVLTCRHVLKGCLGEVDPLPEVRFDVLTQQDMDATVGWSPTRVLCVSPPAGKAQSLDYALLELDRAVGLETSPRGARRGWMNLGEVGATPPRHTPVLIPQHPRDARTEARQHPLRVAFAPSGNVCPGGTEHEVSYFTSTLRGSSGAPVYDGHALKAFAMHRAGGRAGAAVLHNIGIPLRRIVEDLQQRGVSL